MTFSLFTNFWWKLLRNNSQDQPRILWHQSAPSFSSYRTSENQLTKILRITPESDRNLQASINQEDIFLIFAVLRTGNNSMFASIYWNLRHFAGGSIAQSAVERAIIWSLDLPPARVTRAFSCCLNCATTTMWNLRRKEVTSKLLFLFQLIFTHFNCYRILLQLSILPSPPIPNFTIISLFY